MTINLDSEILQSAEQETMARHTMLTEVIAYQLRVLALNCQDSRAGRRSVTGALRGTLKLEAGFDEKAA